MTALLPLELSSQASALQSVNSVKGLAQRKCLFFTIAQTVAVASPTNE